MDKVLGGSRRQNNVRASGGIGMGPAGAISAMAGTGQALGMVVGTTAEIGSTGSNLLWRWNHGPRSMDFMRGLLGLVPAMIANWFNDGGLLMKLYFLVYIALFVFHQVTIWLREADGQPWYSYSTGISWFAPIFDRLNEWVYTKHPKAARLIHFDDGTSQRWLEPAITGFIAMVALQLNTALGLVLTFGALCCFADGQLQYQRMKQAFYDWMDQLIMQEYQQATMQRKPKQQTAGLVIPSMPPGLVKWTGEAAQRQRYNFGPLYTGPLDDEPSAAD